MVVSIALRWIQSGENNRILNVLQAGFGWTKLNVMENSEYRRQPLEIEMKKYGINEN